MSLRRSTILALPFLSFFSLAVACGGSIASPDEREINGGGPGGSNGSSGGQCTAAPACDPGDSRLGQSSVCPGSARCYERSLCGQTIRCAAALDQCGAVPRCKTGYTEVPASSCNTKDCVKETLCGSTIYCKPDVQCLGYPVCDPGHTPVKSPNECWEDDAACYSRSLCGATIWCTGPFAADAGPVPPGSPPEPKNP